MKKTAIETEYLRRTPKSAAMAQSAVKVMPGGNTRTTVFHPPYPLAFMRGEGPWLWDADGNRYLDFFYNGLSIIHGHAYAPIREAIANSLGDGTALGSVSGELVAFAELLQSRLPHAEQFRFTNSGSESGMIAARVARQFTGRNILVKSRYAYHGSYPDLEAGLYGQEDIAGRCLIAAFNDIDSFRQVLARHRGEVAAIVIEPVMFTGRVVAPDPAFLQAVQKLAQDDGCLFILDDCLMLRLAEGGSAEKWGLKPDLTILGKFLGGGLPMGALGGSAKVLSAFDPREEEHIFHGGSFNGNRLSATAGLVAIRDLDRQAIDAMDRRCTTLRQGIEQKAAALGIGVDVSGVGSVAGISFTEDCVRHEEAPSALGLSALFQLACLNAGVSLQPGGLIALSTAIDDDAIDFALRGIGTALEQVSAL